MYESDNPLGQVVDEQDGELTLFSSGLFSKFGFGDGDQLYEWKEAHMLPGMELIGADLLLEAVTEYLLPALRQKVAVEIYETMHNPIRAISVDGVPVDQEVEEDTQEWYSQVERFGLEPKLVTVTPEQLVALFPDLLSVETTQAIGVGNEA